MATKPLRSLTFPGLSDTYTVAATDPTLKLTGEPADAKTVGDWLTTADAKATVAEELSTEGLTDYNYGTDYSDNITSTLAMTRHGMLVTLNGTVALSSNGNPFMIRLNGTPAYGGSGPSISAFTDPLLTLVTGHKYRFKMHRISGSFSGDNLYAGAVKYGGYANLGEHTESGDDYLVDFEPPAEGVQLGVRVSRPSSVATLTNLVLLCTLEDLSIQTDEQRDIEELQETRARIDGSYEGLTAGSAEQLLSTTGAEDRAPYTLRQTGGGVTVGDRAEEKIIGGTITWNQSVKTEQSTSTASGVTFTNNGDGSWTITGVCTGDVRKLVSVISTTAGHVYYGTPGTAEDGSNSTYTVVLSDSGSDKTNIFPANGKIIKPSQTYNQFRIKVYSGFDCGTGVTFKPQFFDLTKMFGSAVADAVYDLEQATTGAGIAWFRAMFPESYYPYNAGELMSVQTSGKTSTSANGTVVKTYPLDSSLILRGIPKWDSVKGTMYYDGDEYTSDGRVKWRYGIVDLGTLSWEFYGTGETAFFYARFTIKKAPGVCTKYAYGSVALDNTMNKVFAPLGTIIRVRDTDYTDAAAFKAAMSGVYLVYELDTPATDHAAPYTGTQWVEAGGTEAFIDAGTETGRVAVPVGHDTFYPTDLRGGLETLLSPEVTVTGTTATINAERDRRYLCGTMNALTFTPCASGLCEVRFTSGTTPTALTLPQTVKMPDWWNGVEANYTYEISIADGVYGAVMAWAT